MLKYIIKRTGRMCPVEVSREKFLEYLPDEICLRCIEQYVESELLIGDSFRLDDRYRGANGIVRKISHRGGMIK